MDKIVYLVTDHGMDGRDKESIIFASYNEQIASDWFEESPNKAWYTKTKRIVETEQDAKQALAKLDGLERLLLNIQQRPNPKK